jgi:protein-disulfide isomerase
LPAAEAAMCAAAQDRFWPMHDALFATQDRWAQLDKPAPLIDSLAVSVGVKANQWRDCMTRGIMRRAVQGDVSRAAASGVRSTPVFFVDNVPIPGAQPIEVFRAAIDAARAKAAGRTPP